MTLIAVIAALWLLAGTATTEAARSPVLDRTFVCSVGDPSTSGYPDPIPARRREFTVRVAPETESRSPWRQEPVPAYIVITDKKGHQTREKLHASQGLDGVVKIGNARYAAPSIIRLDRRTCRPASATPIPLSRRGLHAQPAERPENGLECPVPPRIILRVRAILRRPASLIARGGEYGLTGMPPRVGGEYVPTRRSGNRNVLHVEVAVRAFPAGRAIAYAQIARNGSAALYVSSSCGHT